MLPNTQNFFFKPNTFQTCCEQALLLKRPLFRVAIVYMLATVDYMLHARKGRLRPPHFQAKYVIHHDTHEYTRLATDLQYSTYNVALLTQHIFSILYYFFQSKESFSPLSSEFKRTCDLSTKLMQQADEILSFIFPGEQTCKEII